jgi:hypothetical protein
MIQFLFEYFWATVLIGTLVSIGLGCLVGRAIKSRPEPEISNETLRPYKGSTNGWVKEAVCGK